MTIRFWVSAVALSLAATSVLAQGPAGPMAQVTPPRATAQAADASTSPASSPSSSGPSAAAAPANASGASAAAGAPAAAVATTNSNAKVVVPVGTHVPLVLHNAISTRSARPGDPVYFETVFPVMVDGRVAIPAGSYVSGEVTQTKRAGRVKGRAELGVRLTTLILPNAYEVNLAAAPSNVGTGGNESTNGEGTVIGDSDKSSDAGTVIRTTAEGTGIGAGVGAAAGHVGTGAAIGVGAGAAAGLLAVLLSRGPDAEMPRGTTLDAVLDRPISLDADKVQFTGPGQSTALSGPPDREPVRQKVPF